MKKDIHRSQPGCCAVPCDVGRSVYEGEGSFTWISTDTPFDILTLKFTKLNF